MSKLLVRGTCLLTFLLAGTPGYLAAIGVHYAVGYTNWWHLVPVFSGFSLLVAALILCYPYMCQPDPALHEGWCRFLAGKTGRQHL